MSKQPTDKPMSPPLDGASVRKADVVVLLDGIGEVGDPDRADLNVLISNPLMLLVKRLMPQLPRWVRQGRAGTGK